jgi:VWFA-related protein
MKHQSACLSAAVALLVGLSLALPRAQEAQRAIGTVKEGVTAVLVDVVVRDRRGQPIKDLTQADFEITEDGVPQTIGSFTPILEGLLGRTSAVGARPAAPAGNAAPAGAAPAIAAGPAVTAIVFHGLSLDSRKRAVQAAQGYLGEKEEMSNYVGIFGVDLSLVPLVPFTRNGYAVRQALNRMATGSSAGFNAPEMQQQRANAESAAAAAAAAANAATGSAGAGNSGSVGTGAADAKLAQMGAGILAGFQEMERNQSGYVATDALMAIVRTLGRLPGRKSVVLFSEGLSIPTAVARLFSGVIDAANRANVSIYTIDAVGLRAESEQQKVRNMVTGAGAASEGGYSAEGGGGSYTRGVLEANENALNSDPATLLKQLAVETGGQSFNNTNNLKPAFERVDSDLRNYYMLGYTPINTEFDGKFRTIQVKVKRSGVTVAARKGYVAVRDPGVAPLNTWEASALGALEQKPVPNAFPIRAGALLFPERGRPGLVPVVVEVKTAPLTFHPDKDGKSYTSDFTVLVRFLDGNNQVARKLSEHYEIRGDIAQIDRAKQGEVVFYRESELPPGIYSMEAVVHDGPSGKSSVRFATVEVGRTEDNKLRMSSLMLVRRGENVPEQDRRADNPLLVNGVALSPNLGDPVSKASKEVTFYFAMYPGKGGSGPDVVIELVQNGKQVVQLPMPVPPADANGRIQQLGRLPIDQLAPGTYELRAIARQGDQQLARSTLLRIVD